MLNDLNQTIEKVMDFCQERTDVIMIGGVALLVLIIIISIIKSIAKRDDDNDFDFDENSYFNELVASKRQNAKQSTSPEEEKENPKSTDEAKVTPVTEKCKQSVIFPEELLEELSKVSSNNLQEVEIKIQSAELKFKYTGSKSDSEKIHEEIKVFEEKKEPEPVDVMSEVTAESKTPEPAAEKEQQPELAPEEIEEMKVEAPVKFGAGNYNISKSGKVFTEEELEMQIRD